MKIVLLGPPGAGKGTLARAVIDDFPGVAHISTGDLLRAEIDTGSDLGKQIKKLISVGSLVPDEMITQIIKKKFLTDKTLADGYMLDGFPRTLTQAKDFKDIVKLAGVGFDYAVYLELQEDEFSHIIDRIIGRRICKDCNAVFHLKNRPPRKKNICDYCGGNDFYQRADDNEEIIRKRMELFLENTLPIVKYYEEQGMLRRVNALLDPEPIRDKLLSNENESQD